MTYLKGSLHRRQHLLLGDNLDLFCSHRTWASCNNAIIKSNIKYSVYQSMPESNMSQPNYPSHQNCMPPSFSVLLISTVINKCK